MYNLGVYLCIIGMAWACVTIFKVLVFFFGGKRWR